jgi:type IV pilus assembly protein PilE
MKPMHIGQVDSSAMNSNALPRVRQTIGGFTLIELMITVVIVAILATIAVPSYNSYVMKSRRTEAKSALLDMASSEERYLTANSTYTATPSNLGYGATFPITLQSGYYTVAAADFQITAAQAAANATSPPTPAAFTITARPVGSQANDTQCMSFTVTSTGSQTALNSSGTDNSATCWH